MAEARARVAMQRALGLDVRWVDPDELDDLNPALARGRTLGGSYAPGDGYIDPPRNVLAYTTALFTSGVHVLEGAAFTGLVRTGDRVTGVLTSAGEIATGRVVLTGGPTWPRSAAPPAYASRSAAPGTRSWSPSPTPTWPPTGCRWCSTWRPASTGGPRRAGCCGA